MASIRKRGNTYQIRVSAGYDINGRQLTKTMTWKPSETMTENQIKKELNRQATLFEEKVINGLAGDNRQSFAEYSRYVLNLKERAGLKRSTLERYLSFCHIIDSEIGHIKLSDIRPKHLNDLYLHLSADGMNQRTGGKLSNKTIVEYHRFISSVLSQAEKEMLIPYNPARKATPPKAEKNEANYFQTDELYNILSALKNEPIKYQLATMLLMTTGCRRGEILGLKWSNIDINNKSLDIRNNLLYSQSEGIYLTTTKTGKARKVRIPDELIPLLAEYKKEYINYKCNLGDLWQGPKKLGVIGSEGWISDDFVFIQAYGKPMHPDTISGWLNKFSKKNNLPHINPHAFRHTVASILISQGIDIVTVSKQLGHDKVSTTTDIYAHIINKASEQATDTISNVIFKKKA